MDAVTSVLSGSLLIWVFLVPVGGAFMVLLSGAKSEGLRNILAVIVSGITCLMCAVIFLQSANNPLSWEWGNFLNVGMFMKADVFGAFMALAATFIWFLATVFSVTYMDHEVNKNRYYLFYLLTLGACAGVFLAGDFFSLFIFFEMMSLTSYVLVIHTQTKESMSAGRNYLFLSVFGGLLILSGIILLYRETGSTALAPMMSLMADAGITKYVITALLIGGFGIKAGMLPLHIWLPKAHPVAPAPASALLSGIMIKTGAYGIIRTVMLVMTPADGSNAELWGFAREMGTVIIAISIVTMLGGAVMALFQTNIKRVLAYSSISQMGYILMGVGSAAYLGYEGTMGFAGFSYHILNHAFFKAGMFMMVGAVYYRTHELEFSRLGGLARYFPVTAAAFLIAVMGIAGFPGCNGYISKTLLHHGIEYVYKGSDSGWFLAAERLFTLTGALTVCYVSRLYYNVFWGQKPDNLHHIEKEPLSEKIVFGTFAGVIVFLGLFPQLILSRVIVPAARGFVFKDEKVEYLLKQDFINWTDLQGVFIPITAGLILLVVMTKTGIFDLRLPGWFSVEKLIYTPVTRLAMFLFTYIGNGVETITEHSIIKSPGPLAAMCYRISHFERVTAPGIGVFVTGWAARIRDILYEEWVGIVNAITAGIRDALVQGFRTLVNIDKKPAAGKSQVFTFANLEFSLFIVVIVLIVILGVTFILS